jgi:hypothetical protein
MALVIGFYFIKTNQYTTSRTHSRSDTRQKQPFAEKKLPPWPA